MTLLTHQPIITEQDEDDLSDNDEVSVAVKRLTDDELLLIAQDRRGLKIPTHDQRAQIIQRAHDMGHQGTVAMYRNITRLGFWWPHTHDDIAKVVHDCTDCMRYTVVKRGYHPLRSVTSKYPGDHYMIDIMTLPESTDGLTELLVIIDVFTGFVVLKPLLNHDPATIARSLFETFCIIGPPRVLQSDQDASFLDPIMEAMHKLVGIEHRIISQYHPQADGKVERTIRTVRDMINKEIRGAHQHWTLFVPMTQLSFNYRVSTLTGSSPFSLMFGRNVNEFIDYTKEDAPEHVDLDDWKTQQERILSVIFPAIHLRARQVQQKYINHLHQYKQSILEHDLPAGTRVMILDPQYIKSVRPKHINPYIGPYYVVRRTLHGPYVLRDETGDVYQRHVPLDQIKVTQKKRHHINYDLDKDVYHVDYIVDDRVKDGHKQYLIKWSGYRHADNTWEDASKIDVKIIARYLKRKSKKQDPVSDVQTHIYHVSGTLDDVHPLSLDSMSHCCHSLSIIMSEDLSIEQS